MEHKGRFLKKMMKNMENGPEAPTNLPQLLQAIGLLGEISAFQRKLDMQFKGKLKMFKDMEVKGVPKILDEPRELKDFMNWKEDFGSIVPCLLLFTSLERLNMQC